jgi:tetratricopeptide (TPR) repeat protein
MTANLSKLNEFMKTGNYAKAEFYLYEFLQSNPNDYTLNKNLGMTLLAQKKYDGALTSFEKCYFLNKEDFDTVLNLSFLFLRVQDHEQSIRFAEEALTIDAKASGALQNLATCYLEMKDFDKASHFAEKVIELRGGIISNEFLQYKDFIDVYGDILLAKKEDESFCKFAEKILEKKIFIGDLFLKLFKHDKKKIKKEYVEVISSIIKSPEEFENSLERYSQLAAANICLAEYNSKIDKNLSEKQFLVANNHIVLMQRSPIYARQKMYINLTEYFSSFNEDPILNHINPEKGAGLIFIIGMPRSGTTLTESILSTAENIFAGGEKVFFNNNLWPIFSDLKPGLQIDPKFIEELGDRYLSTIDLQRNGKKHFIDKMPSNFLFYKFIQLALPKAKFIHTFRNSWDNAISLFKANYQDTIIYASSFFGIANEYSNYSALMRFWKKNSNHDSFFDVEYEKMVTNTEESIQKLWNFCSLSGEFSDIKRKAHYANTASKQQVSKDIYKSSLKKEEFMDLKDKFYDDLAQQDSFWAKRGI